MMVSVYEGGSVITLDQVESREGLRIVSDIGSRLPVFCTSQGKVFLAHMSRAGAENLLRSQSLTQFTPHTIMMLGMKKLMNTKKPLIAFSLIIPKIEICLIWKEWLLKMLCSIYVT